MRNKAICVSHKGHRYHNSYQNIYLGGDGEILINSGDPNYRSTTNCRRRERGEQQWGPLAHPMCGVGCSVTIDMNGRRRHMYEELSGCYK
jgi:hypothetical protein